MRSILALLALACICEAKPSVHLGAVASFSMESFIFGGEDATPGEFPWQLSQQRRSGVLWSHSCGASLLSSRYALSAAHCVDGASTAVLRVWAGLHDRTVTTGGVMASISTYKMHESYGTGAGTFPNDIAILTLSTEISSNGGTIQYATLPADNSNDYAGSTCTMSGWGRTSESSTLPTILQKGNIGVITTAECNTLLSPVSGASAADGHICLYDTAQQTGSCNGDSGGPLSCGSVVTGVTSWGISSDNVCLMEYPSIYTRTGYYLGWIEANTP